MLRHAYLIIAHNDFYILEKLIKLLDYENNDFFIHIDSKVKDFDFDYYKKLTKKSNIYFTKRMNVKWGTFSQIKCEYLVLEKAIKGNYDYYHLLSGTDLPLKRPEEIQKFFQENNSKEFVHFYNFNKIEDRYLERINIFHFFVTQARSKKSIDVNLFKIGFHLKKIEKKFKINRIKNLSTQFRNGANWFSITDDLANYVIRNKKFVFKHFKLTSCADELFLQTLVYNSIYKQKLYCYNDNNYKQIQRYIDWNRGEPYTFNNNDFDELINSDMLFARKFSTKVDKEIVDHIYNYLKGK